MEKLLYKLEGNGCIAAIFSILLIIVFFLIDVNFLEKDQTLSYILRGLAFVSLIFFITASFGFFDSEAHFCRNIRKDLSAIIKKELLKQMSNTRDVELNQEAIDNIAYSISFGKAFDIVRNYESDKYREKQVKKEQNELKHKQEVDKIQKEYERILKIS